RRRPAEQLAGDGGAGPARQCRYCLGCEGEEEDFVAPCACTGGQQWVHFDCLRRWQRSVLVLQPTHPALYGNDNLRRMTHCGVCTQPFSCPPPSRHEMMTSFTGAELAALVQEQSLVCASEAFSAALRAQLHSALHRRSHLQLRPLVPRGLPDLLRRASAPDALHPGRGQPPRGHRGHGPRGPPDAARAPVPDAARGPARAGVGGPEQPGCTERATGSTAGGSRGAQWVQSALGSAAPAAPGAGQLRRALAALPLPAEVALQTDGAEAEACDPSDDSIRAVNLGNRVSAADLSDGARAAVRQACRKLPRGLRGAVRVEHYLGGPCSPSQCVVLAPVGGPDGLEHPLPRGFRGLQHLGVAVGTDIGAALQALPAARCPAAAAGAGRESGEGSACKVRRTAGPEGSTRLDGVDCPAAAGSRAASDDDDDDADADADASAPESVGSDASGLNAAELAGASPPSRSASSASGGAGSGDEAATARRIDPDDMVVGVAAESLTEDVTGDALERPAPAPCSPGRARARPLMVFWGEARWHRTQLLGELARGDWGLCRAAPADLGLGSHEAWRRVAQEERRPVYAPRSEMTREAILAAEAREAPAEPPPGRAPGALRTLGWLIAAHQEAIRQQEVETARLQEADEQRGPREASLEPEGAAAPPREPPPPPPPEPAEEPPAA
ncbi:unnamed protein product, partial [Prorocentrum cordatum]